MGGRYSQDGIGGQPGDTPEYIAERTRQEMAARKSKPNPAGRPSADDSTALKALRRSLAEAREPALRERLKVAIAALESTYRPNGTGKPVQRRSVAPVKPIGRPGSMRAYAAELLQQPLSYQEIRRRVIERFPICPHGHAKGKPSRFRPSEIKTIARELIDAGIRLPARPRERRALTEAEAAERRKRRLAWRRRDYAEKHAA